MNNIVKYSIDRIEGDIAVCEDLNTHKVVNINKKDLPSNCKEGDIIVLNNGKYSIDKEETSKQKDEISSMVNSLFKKKN